MVISLKHLPQIVLSHVSTKYMQGHQHLDIKPWGQGTIITVKQRSEVLLSYPQSSDQCIYNTRVGVVLEKGQLLTNCNSSPFIIVSGSLNNTLYLWSKARKSGIVWEVLRSWHTQRGNTGQFRVVLDSFHRHCRAKLDFFKSPNCVEIILK